MKSVYFVEITEILREGSPPHTCHVSGVTCHVSPVTCHMSRVRFYFFWGGGQSGEASQGRVCYQRGLPRLVYYTSSLSVDYAHYTMLH